MSEEEKSQDQNLNDENNLEEIFSSTSPLTEADPESLDELFSRIDKKLVLGLPKEITDQDIQRVVDYYTFERIRFVQDQANFIKPGKRASNGTSQGSKTKQLIEKLSNTKLDF